MAQPYFITDAGNLGTIQELEFYNLQLIARDPEEASNNTGLTFTLLAGKLPDGVAMAFTGLIDGIPTERSKVKGVPYEVSENITSTFVVRITDAEGLIADRTFSLTVAGPDSPVWAVAEGKILDVHDGEEVNISVAATDSDGDVLTYSLGTGLLPPGLTLNTATGQITGRVNKLSGNSQEFTFFVRVTDSQFTIERKFSIVVHAINDGRADRTQDALGNNITVDSDWNMWLADVYLFARPWMTTPASSVGRFRHSNYYIERFYGKLLEDLPSINFEIRGNKPSTLTFDGVYDIDATDKEGSCLLYGSIPSSTATQLEYKFSIRPSNTLNDNDYSPAKSITIYGEWVEYTLLVQGEDDTEVVWS